MWGFLFQLIPGVFKTINGITDAIANERLTLIQAKTDRDKIASQERLNALNARRDVMLAESNNSNINAIIRACIAVGPASYLLKIFIYDKVFGTWTHGTTDPLDANLWAVVTAVLGFYFLYEGATSVARIVKA